VPVIFGGHNLPPMVEIGLTDLPKSWGTMASPAPPGTSGKHKPIGHGSVTVEGIKIWRGSTTITRCFDLFLQSIRPKFEGPLAPSVPPPLLAVFVAG
jgi:hypothetical protein